MSPVLLFFIISWFAIALFNTIFSWYGAKAEFEKLKSKRYKVKIK